MSPLSLSIISILVKATLLLTAAAATYLVLRPRTSAAARHLLWTLTITGLLLLPALAVVLPSWSLPLPSPLAGVVANALASLGAAPPAASTPLAAGPIASSEAARPAESARALKAGPRTALATSDNALGARASSAERIRTDGRVLMAGPDDTLPAPHASGNIDAELAKLRAAHLASPASNLGPRAADAAPRASARVDAEALAKLRTAQFASPASNLGPHAADAAPRASARVDAEALAKLRTAQFASPASNLGPHAADAAPRAGARADASGSVRPQGWPQELRTPSPLDSRERGQGVRVSAASLLLTLYAAGALVLFGRVALQQLAVRRLARRAVGVDDPEWTQLYASCARSLGLHPTAARLLRSRDRTMPMTFGSSRPVILLPAIADTWSDERRRAVLLHELAHVARRDCLTQTLATIACAIYWPHPGVWLVARQLRIERELACDDRVLSAGTQARDYAGHLLDIAYSLGGGRAPALVVTMARRRQLEGRMLAVLDDSRNRETPRPRSRFAAIAMTAAVLVPLATTAGVTTIAARDAGHPGGPQGDELSQRDGQAPQPAQQPQARQGEQQAQPQQLAQGPQQPQGSQEPQQRVAMNQQQPMLQQSLHAVSWSSLASNWLWSTLTGNAPLAGGQAQASGDGNHNGTWEIRQATDVTSGVPVFYVRLGEVTRNGNWSSTSPVRMDRIEGLTQATFTGAGGPVTFKIRRDAGTFTFEGVIRNGVGGGTYSFAPDPGFPQQLVQRGIGRPTPEEQYELARMDAGLEFVDELAKQGYQKPDVALLVRAAQHGVGLEYLRDMGSLGYKVGLVDDLIKLRDHGVSARYIRELANDGYTHLSPDELTRTRDHGVTPDYLHALHDAGYRQLSLEQAIKARDHGISAQFVNDMNELGYTKLTLDQLIEARDHGVSGEYARNMKSLGYALPLADLTKARDHGVSEHYAREMAAAGYGKLSLDELTDARAHGVSENYVREMKAMGYSVPLSDLINARDHGVSEGYVRDMNAAGFGKLSLDALTRAKDHGVSPDFASGLKTLGYPNVSLDDLIVLRDHGVSTERVRKANERAGTKLPLDLIKSLADGGGLR